MGVSMDCPNFWLPPVISGTGKVTDLKFCRNIHRVEKRMRNVFVAVDVVRESRKFLGHPCICALRGHLCDSTVLFFGVIGRRFIMSLHSFINCEVFNILFPAYYCNRAL